MSSESWSSEDPREGEMFICETIGCEGTLIFKVKGYICSDCEGKFCEDCVYNGTEEGEDEWICEECYRSYFP